MEKNYNLTKKELNAEKIKVLAKFASIASHDLKNVVAGLSNISYFLNKSINTEDEKQKKMLNLLSVEVVELNNRITEILDMTRVKQIKKAPCDLKYVVTKAVESLKKDGIVIDADIVSAKLYGDIEKLSQMFFNIIKNAKDALEQSGVVKIVKIVSSVEGENAVIMVSDKGKGMDAETLEQCFDPMFSTKTAKAVGMGLTTALQIAEMHNGTIKISSVQNEGTTVVVSLPIMK